MSDEGGLQRQFFEMLMDSQWWSAEQLRNYQRSQLSQLLRHAKKNVPFYEHRLDAVVKPNGDIDWDRWNEIPIVKREDIVEYGDVMLSTDLPDAHGRTTVSTTSGTSGAPITLTSTELSAFALYANRFRSYAWHGIDTSRTCVSILGEEPELAWPHGKLLGNWGPFWEPSSKIGQLLRISRLTTVPQLNEFFGRHRPAYFTTGPKSALALAIEMDQMGLRWQFEAFFPHGSSVDPEDRAAVTQVFGARSIDLYSSKEAGQIAHACPLGRGLHINEESLLVELLDDDGQMVPPGAMGRVVVTPFFNAAQPLIRYDQGDVARWMPAVCACGRHLQRLDAVIGRSNTIFYHPDGRVRVSYLGHHRHLLNCSAWQIAQVGPTDYEVRYVPIKGGGMADEDALAEKLRAAYFEDAQVRFVRVENVSLTEAGKPLEYVNEWRRPIGS